MKNYHVPLLIGLTVAASVLSLHAGLHFYSPVLVWNAVMNPDGSADHLIIANLRMPRTLVALLVGAALATSGLLMQSVFRNPLAEPGLLGVNAGAGFAVVAGFALFGISSIAALSLLALVGALATMAAIFMLVLAARGGMTPVALVLAGVTLAALLASMTQMLIITDESTMEALLFWLAGGFADRNGPMLWALAPVLILGVGLATLSANALDAMATGDAAASALGVNTTRLRIMVLGLASVLAALSVMIAGPVGFVGLVAPHLARLIAGTSHARLFPRAALIGAALAVCADIAARIIVAPQEAPITAMLALVGAPVLVSLIRTGSLKVAA